MKSTFTLIVFSFFSAQLALASCPETDQVKQAKELSLIGPVLIELKSLDGKDLKEPKEDTSQHIPSNPKKFISDENQETIVSNIFFLENDFSAMTIIQNTKTCDLSVVATDGEYKASFKIVQDGIEPNSVSFYINDSTITKISTIKK